MASFFNLEDEEFYGIAALEMDGRNWQDYRTVLDQVVAKVGLSSYLVGTFPEGFEKSLDTQVKFLITSALPDSILVNIIYFDTAYKIFDYPRQRYEKATDDKDSMQVVASPVEVVDMHVHSHENGPSVPLAEEQDGHRMTGDTIPAHAELTVFNPNGSDASGSRDWNHISGTSSGRSCTLPDAEQPALFRNHFRSFPALFRTRKHCMYRKCFDKFA